MCDARDTKLCVFCDAPVKGAFVNMLEGFKAHPTCYNKRHAYSPKQTFMQVLTNNEDQFLMRELVNLWMPEPFKQQVVDIFNGKMQERQAANDAQVPA